MSDVGVGVGGSGMGAVAAAGGAVAVPGYGTDAGQEPRNRFIESWVGLDINAVGGCSRSARDWSRACVYQL
jgi:hypothetical protein